MFDIELYETAPEASNVSDWRLERANETEMYNRHLADRLGQGFKVAGSMARSLLFI